MNADDALDTLTTTQVYGIYHDAADDPLIYVGATRDYLPRRLDYHRNAANQPSKTSPIHRYIDEEVANPREDLSIEELPYDSEQAAIDALGDDTLNVYAAAPARWYDWTLAKVKRLISTVEEDGLAAAQRTLDPNPNQVRNAALRLGLIEPRDYNHVDWSEWDDKLGTISDRKLAKEIGCSKANVSRRRKELGISPARNVLSEEQVLHIWVLYHLMEDASYPDVAEEVEEAYDDLNDVSRRTIGRVIRRETHTDVTLPSPAAIEAADAYNTAEDAFRDAEGEEAV